MATPAQKEELRILRDTAKKAGIKFAPNIGLQSLRTLVRTELAAPDNNALLTQVGDVSEEMKELDKIKDQQSMEARALKARIKMPMLPSFQTKIKKEQNARLKCGKLIRIVAHNNSPLKKEWEGDILTASNELGTWKKYIQFDVEWHVPTIIVNMMREKKYSHFYTKKDALGMQVRKARLLPEYNIEVLEPLTALEVEQLAKRQIVTMADDDD